MIVHFIVACHKWQIVKAVQGRIPVFLDGGVRRGTDVFKALALGACGVFVSKFICYLLGHQVLRSFVTFTATDWLLQVEPPLPKKRMGSECALC